LLIKAAFTYVEKEIAGSQDALARAAQDQIR